MKTKAFTGIALSILGSNLLLAQTKPNMLYIMTDQQSYNMMSCMGNKWLSTPNMDKIARMGYRFDKTYCANPVCMPSRYALLTGHYGSEVGAKQNIDKLIYSTPKLREIVTESALGNVFRKGCGIALTSCADVTVNNCETARNGWYGMLVSESSKLTITGNLIEANDNDGIMIQYLYTGSDDVRISNNLIQYNQGFGITSYAGKNIKTIHNTFAGNGIDLKSNEKISTVKYINMQ